ncbi:hypothetical protein AWH63_10380 [Marinobacter sp. C18]|uniref:hypothetical protein n=1 Tax=Marinobacter sp. C18 TaxID=1772288 RepID=UPI000948B034|nr:hypothetical protein [Marinobacter sp. C18]OLF81938.1 hypothetical protein AWH63_10380 [Marinobacter sp. C18]
MNQGVKFFMQSAVCIVLVGLGQSVHAETIGQIVQKQQELTNLDHQINRSERLLDLQELQVKIKQVNNEGKPRRPPKGQGNTQVEYFGATPSAAANGQRPEGAEPRKPQKTAEEERRERIRSMLDDAVLKEAYVPQNSPSDDFIGVIGMTSSGRNFEVRDGSVIEGWEVKSVELDRVVFENTEFGIRKTVFQAR